MARASSWVISPGRPEEEKLLQPFLNRDFYGPLFAPYPLLFLTPPTERDVDLTISQINTHKIRGASIFVIAEENEELIQAARRPPTDAANYRSLFLTLPRTGSPLLFPFSAMVFTSTVKTFFDVHPLIHLLTFGGHDVGCRVAAATINEYDRIQPWQNAKKQGNILKEKLKQLATSNPKLKSVQGVGLMLSLEFENAEAAEKFCRSAIQQGVLVKSGEVAKHSVVIRPPLTINGQDLDKIVTGIEKALNE